MILTLLNQLIEIRCASRANILILIRIVTHLNLLIKVTIIMSYPINYSLLALIKYQLSFISSSVCWVHIYYVPWYQLCPCFPKEITLYMHAVSSATNVCVIICCCWVPPLLLPVFLCFNLITLVSFSSIMNLRSRLFVPTSDWYYIVVYVFA